METRTVLASCGVAGAALLLYLYHVNRAMMAVPEEARRFSPNRWTTKEIREAYEKAVTSPVDVTKSIPPKQNRRYVVIGGSGLVGNWIISHLLTRGEDPKAIRVLDLQAPQRELLNQGVTFIKTNITDEKAVFNAFAAPWPSGTANLALTVFHNAAVIRPAERHPSFLPLCSKVNVTGTANILNAAKAHHATCMIATSSGSIALRRVPFWIAPWTKSPTNLTQIISDATPIPQTHDQFFGNYAVSKAQAESLVRDADSAASNFRTGCIRPANGIYGIGADTSATLTGQYLRSAGAPSWTYDVIQSFVNAENVSIAHLCYEQRLIELSESGSSSGNLPDIGGQAFVVTDPNPAVTFGDVYSLLGTLSKTPVNFPHVSAVPLLLLAHVIEWYALLQHKFLPWLLPRVKGDLAQMQPALFSVASVHTIADDERARRAPEKGGLGYDPPITTLEGMAKEVEEWNRRAGGKEETAAVENSGKVSIVSPAEKL